MIKRIVLKNFKRHEHRVIDFAEGLNSICGPNYSGKSTILHGVQFALWGSSAVPGGASVVKGRKSDKPAQVVLDFEVEGKYYRIERSSGKVRLFCGDDMIASSASAVTEKVEELLGLEKRRFLQLRVAEQKRTEALLTLGATELHNVIEEVSGADVISYVISRASDIASEAKGGLDALPSVDLTDLKEDLKTLEKAVAQHSKAVTAMDESLSKALHILEGVKEARSRAQRNNQRRQKLLEQTQKAKAELDQAKAELQECQQIVADNEKDAQGLESVKAKQSDLRKQISEAGQRNKSIESLTGKVAELKANLSDLEKKLKSLKSQAPDFDAAALKAAKEKEIEARTNHREANSALRKVMQSLKESYCHACKRALDGSHIEELEKEKAELGKKVQKLSTVLDSDSGEASRLGSLEVLFSKHKETLSALEATFDTKARILEASTEELEQLGKPVDSEKLADWEKELEVVGGLYNKAVAANDRVEQAKAKSSRASNRINLLTEQLAEVGEIPAEVPLAALDASVEEAQQNSDHLKSEYHDAKSSKQYAEHRKGEVEDQIGKAEKVLSKRKSLEGRLKTSQELSKYLRKNRDRFLMEIWDGVMGYATHFVSSCTENAIESVSRSEDGKFGYVEAGEAMPIEAASGAQRSLMGLGVQMALSQMLPTPFGSILLDEPTSDMDEERSTALAMMLANSSSQVIMVSHRQFDNAVSNHTIELGGVW